MTFPKRNPIFSSEFDASSSEAFLERSTEMFAKVRKFARDESGATAIEYGLIAALVSVAGIAALNAMGDSLQEMFETVAEEINNANG